ncbi:MAG: hypothetical protein AAGE43_15830 [Pseudomonadota bacterium]
MISINKASLTATATVLSALLMFASAAANAADSASAAEAMARALQDPLANIRMLATDNTISFNSGLDDGSTNYKFQLQPFTRSTDRRMQKQT